MISINAMKSQLLQTGFLSVALAFHNYFKPAVCHLHRVGWHFISPLYIAEQYVIAYDYCMNKSTRGSAHVIIIVLIIVALVGVLGYMAWNAYKKAPVTNNVKSDGTKISYIDWSFDGSVWKPASTPPNCEQPLLIGAPMDVSKATSKLYPGQVRGTDFKPHGGLAVDTAASTSLNVYAIRDAYLFRGSRYIENDVIQYLLCLLYTSPSPRA